MHSEDGEASGSVLADRAAVEEGITAAVHWELEGSGHAVRLGYQELHPDDLATEVVHHWPDYSAGVRVEAPIAGGSLIVLLGSEKRA